MVRETSLLAYRELSEIIGERRAQVLKALIQIQPAFDTQIAEKAKLPINCITGRRGELVEMGYVLEHDKKRNQFARMATRWKVNREAVEKLIKQNIQDVQTELSLF